ncbi:hypothetical protein M513_08205 [Trichuris suis]|uniref:Uncharacterized protein n=1 Tax=Trichuris suis TaxID=68888 RepID=A0A085M0Z6_9BILA|nr:hypothetical protein M513_08205 [Trichuris suis]
MLKLILPSAEKRSPVFYAENGKDSSIFKRSVETTLGDNQSAWRTSVGYPKQLSVRAKGC